MKKLITAAAIVCVAAFAHASSVKWSSTGMTGASQIKGPDGTTLVYSWAEQTGYSITKAILMNTADYTQAQLLTGLREGTYTWGDSKLDETSVNSSSKITAKTSGEFSSLGGTTIDVYYAILAEDASGNQTVLLSTTLSVDVPASEGASGTASWGTAAGTFSSNVMGDAAYESAGWYSVVPEPTSGLLMLLGMAGLALRRRRA